MLKKGPTDGSEASAELSLDDPCWWWQDKALAYYRSPEDLVYAVRDGRIGCRLDYLDHSTQPPQRRARRAPLEILWYLAVVPDPSNKIALVNLPPEWQGPKYDLAFWGPDIEKFWLDATAATVAAEGETREFASAEQWFYGDDRIKWRGARIEIPQRLEEKVEPYQMRLLGEGKKVLKKLKFSTLRKMYYDRSKRSK